MSNLEKIIQCNADATFYENKMEDYLKLGDMVLNADEVKIGLPKKTGFGEAIKAKVMALDFRLHAKRIALRSDEAQTGKD